MAALDLTMGAMLIGVLFAGVLYGVSCLQAWLYFNKFPKDRCGLKFLVMLVWILDTTHQALISHTAYTYLVTHFTQVGQLDRLVWSLIVEVLISGILAFLVQSFYVHRIWWLSECNMLLSALLFSFVLAEFGCVIVYTAKALLLRTFEQLDDLKRLSMIVNAFAAVSDVVIASTLCFILHTSRTGFPRSNHVINKLMIFTLNTGLLTSVFAILSLITIVVLPNTFIYICFFFAMARLYSNSFLATLNARHAIRRKVTAIENSHFALEDMRCTNAPGTTSISVRIDTTRELIHDNFLMESEPAPFSPTTETGDMSIKDELTFASM